MQLFMELPPPPRRMKAMEDLGFRRRIGEHIGSSTWRSESMEIFKGFGSHRRLSRRCGQEDHVTTFALS